MGLPRFSVPVTTEGRGRRWRRRACRLAGSLRSWRVPYGAIPCKLRPFHLCQGVRACQSATSTDKTWLPENNFPSEHNYTLRRSREQTETAVRGQEAGGRNQESGVRGRGAAVTRL